VNRPPNEPPRWLDDPAHVTLIYRILIVTCIALVGLGVPVAIHGHFRWETWIGFYGLYGFVSCVTLVLVAKVLRRILKRPEDYYDR
jgi:hypothetical protein